MNRAKLGIVAIGIVIVTIAFVMVFYVHIEMVPTTNTSTNVANRTTSATNYSAPFLHYYSSYALSFNSSEQLFIINTTKLGMTFPYTVYVMMLPKSQYANYSSGKSINLSNYILVIQNSTAKSFTYYYSSMINTLKSEGISKYNIMNYTFLGHEGVSMNTTVGGEEIVNVIIMDPTGKFTMISMHNSNSQLSSKFSSALNEIESSLYLSS